MSGHKRATISLSEFDLNRLEHIEGKLKQVEKDYESIRNRSKVAQENEFSSQMADLLDQHENLKDSLDQNYAALYQDFQIDLQTVNEQNQNELIINTSLLQSRLLELDDRSWNQSLEIISEFQKNMDHQSNTLLSEIQTQINQVTQNISMIEQSKEEYCGEVLNSTQSLFYYINDNLPVERYYPGALDNLSIEINLGVTDLQRKMYDAGLSILQQASLKLWNIRQDVIKKDTARNSLLSTVNRRISELIGRIRANRFVPAVDLDGNELDIEVDTAFWSGSIYEKTLRKTLAFQNQLSKNGENFSFDELADIITNKIPALEEKFSEAVYQARRNVIASQVRFNIAGSVIQALGAQGFQLNGGRYVESDQRGSYQALLKHVDGSEVVVQVSEVEGEMGTSQVDLETLHPQSYTQHELRHRAKELAVSLADYGLQIGKFPLKQSIIPPKEQAFLPNNNLSDKQIREAKVSYGRN